MTIITVTDDGQDFDVDTSRISGWDAITYEATLGGSLEGAVLDLLGKSPIVLASDRSIVKWLWVRQNQDPTATVASVASTVRAIPDPEPDDAAVE